MLRDVLKSEIDQLSEDQLSKLAGLIEQLKTQPQPTSQPKPKNSNQTTPPDQLQRFRAWIAKRPSAGINLPDEAFDRGTTYD